MTLKPPTCPVCDCRLDRHPPALSCHVSPPARPCLKLVPELTREQKIELRRVTVIRDWWDASTELQRLRNEGKSTADDLFAARLAWFNLSTFQLENPSCCVGG